MKTSIIALALASIGAARWDNTQHDYSPSTSAEIAAAIKQKLLDNINSFADVNFAKSLKNDLNTDKDSDRTLKEISALSANQLFGALGLKDPECDANGDGVVKGDELKCLNFAWKAFLPK